jgi:hypothetical protein
VIRLLKHVRDYRDSMRAAGLFGRASRLVKSDRCAEAIPLLQRSISLVQNRGAGMIDGPQFASLLCSTTLLAQAAARVGEHHLASESLRKGMALWSEAKLEMPQLRSQPSMVAWEEWARKYKVWLEAEGLD